MQDVLYVDEAAHAEALLKPLRLQLIKCLADPKSCPELAQEFDESTQKIYYHVKILEKAGLVEKVEERKVRGILEGRYQAKARSYWLSPHLVGHVGDQSAPRDQLSLGFLLDLAEELQTDIGKLSATSVPHIPSLGLGAEIELGDPETRAEFLAEVQTLFKELAKKYGASKGRSAKKKSESYKLKLACYPKSEAVETQN